MVQCVGGATDKSKNEKNRKEESKKFYEVRNRFFDIKSVVREKTGEDGRRDMSTQKAKENAREKETLLALATRGHQMV